MSGEKSFSADLSSNGTDLQLDPALSEIIPSYREAQENLPNDGRVFPHDSQHMQPDPIDFLPSRILTTNLSSGIITPSGLIGFGMETDLDFSAIDLGFLDAYNVHIPFELDNQALDLDSSHTGIQDEQDRPQKPSNGQLDDQNKFLHRSIWRFVPTPEIHGYSEQTNLSLPNQDKIVESPDSFTNGNRRATAEKLDPQTRDKILAIVIGQLKPQIMPAVASFPSLELLDNLIQFFLAGPMPSVRSWIHTSSFRPRKTRPELLLAMAAAGAVLTPDRSLRKLGYAIQEVIRNHLPTIFESDNTTIRGLELQQALMLNLDIGVWSGNSRKIEIAESFQQPLLTMLRRGGRFKRSAYPLFMVSAEDDGKGLDRKWRTWVEQESLKRLVYKLLGHDAKTSMSLSVSPLFSYSELALPLPESQGLWEASSATEWKTMYCTKYATSSTRIPSLTECVANLDLLETYGSLIDIDLSCSAYLFAVWGMVWEYRKLSLLFRNQANVWDKGLILMTRYQELTKIFDCYRLSYGDKSTLLLELILVHLHASLEDIQLLLGFEGPEESRQAQLSVKEWANSKASRQAVWHAGQLIKATGSLPPLQLRDFNAVALFHAGLTLWAYGQAGRMFTAERSDISEGAAVTRSHSASQAVWLDEDETITTLRYISLGRGQPTLHGARPDLPSAPLSDSKAIIETLLETMNRGDGEPLRPKSPLVENLMRIIEHLKDI